MNRVYTNGWAKLDVGTRRYGLMCGEDGMLFDDGVTACLGDNHFLMTTTGGAAGSMSGSSCGRRPNGPILKSTSIP